MSKFDDWYNGFMLEQKNTSLIAYGSKKLLAISAWDASEEIARKSERERVLDEVRAFIEIVANNYYKATMFDHSSAASCIAEELKQKYGGEDG